MKMEWIATKFPVEIVKSGQYVSKGSEVEEIAKNWVLNSRGCKTKI